MTSNMTEREINEPENIKSLGAVPSEKPISLLSLIPDTFEGHLQMSTCDPTTLTRDQRRALVLHEKLVLRRNRQVGAILRAIACISPSWTEERAQKSRDYWTDSAKLMPGMTVQEMRASLEQRLRESTIMTPEKIAWKAAYSTRWRTRFHADGGQRSSVIADTVPR
ncbi:hypothetical protein [Rhodoferax lacus]|nr:hypothetical protein [Rhodoferax lacus]